MLRIPFPLFADVSICVIEFDAWWETIGIQVLLTTFKQHIIHFRYSKMYHVRHISLSIWQMSSGDHFTTDISELLDSGNMKETYQSTIKVNCIWQMLKHNGRSTSLANLEEILSYLALHGWYDIDYSNVFNLATTTDKWQSTHRAHLTHLVSIQDEPSIRPVLHQVSPLWETHVCSVCRSDVLTSLRDASEDFGTPYIEQLFHSQKEEGSGHKVSGVVLGYDQNILIDSIFGKLQNGLLYYQPFHSPTSVECLGLDCKVEYMNVTQGIMTEAHIIWVQYIQCEENDLNNTFQGQIPSFHAVLFCWTPPNQILQFQECLPARKAMLTFSNRWKMTQQGVLRPQAQEYAVVIPM